MALIAGVLSVAVIGALGYFLGYAVGRDSGTQERLRQLGFTRASARLYTRAAKLLNRMVTVTELDGDFAADILSPTTKKAVQDWIADYRKEINR